VSVFFLSGVAMAIKNNFTLSFIIFFPTFITKNLKTSQIIAIPIFAESPLLKIHYSSLGLFNNSHKYPNT
tara:strand:+ start:549 stop:758 length:210 start_codon:yes stop_codon:yes gene_type:complete